MKNRLLFVITQPIVLVTIAIVLAILALSVIYSTVIQVIATRPTPTPMLPSPTTTLTTTNTPALSASVPTSTSTPTPLTNAPLPPILCIGAVLGFLVAGVVSFILVQIRNARMKAGHKDRSLDKFPDSAHPNLTPAGIVRTSQEAQFSVILWTLVLIIFLGLVLVGVYFLTVPG